MKNPLHKELEDLRYISISSIDPYDIPESVIIYFKNSSEINKKMSIETIHGTQLDLQNQNPTIVLENYKATFCLGSTPYVPTVTIDPIEDILDPEYPRKITFTGTVSRTDDYIPNDILVEYNGVTMRASLVDDTHWSVTYDLIEVTEDTDQVVSAKANSIDVNNPEMDGEFSLPVEETFKILFTVVDCIPVNDKINCLCLDIKKRYRITVDGESITGSFEEIVSFLDKHGLYAYPSVSECNPSYEGSSDITEEVPTVTVEVELNDVEDNSVYYLYDNTTYYYKVFIRNTSQFSSTDYVIFKDNDTGIEYLLNSANNFETRIGIVFRNTNPYINGISRLQVSSNFEIIQYSLPLDAYFYNIYMSDHVLCDQDYNETIASQLITVNYTEASTGIVKTISTNSSGFVDFYATLPEVVNADLNYPLTITIPNEFVGHSVSSDGMLSSLTIISEGGTTPTTNTVVFQKKNEITSSFDLKLRLHTSDKNTYDPIHIRQLYINQINIVGNL